MTEAELAIVRRAYAKQVMVPFEPAHSRVEAAFAAVRREPTQPLFPDMIAGNLRSIRRRPLRR
jgi:hypothetical protein